MRFDTLAAIGATSSAGAGVIADLRRRLPGPVAARRRLARPGRGVGAMLALAVAAAAAAWTADTVMELNRYVTEQRTAATKALLAQYGEPPVIDSWVRLSRTWAAHGEELEPLLARLRAAEGPELERLVLVWDYVINRIVEEENLEPDIGVVWRFYERLAFCVATGACDPGMTAEHLGRDPWRFRNMHYPYLVAAFPGEDFDAELARIAPPSESG